MSPSDEDDTSLQIGVWEWDRPKTIDDELYAETIFAKVFDTMRAVLDHKASALEMSDPDEMVAVITALIEVSVQGIMEIARLVGIDPLVVVDTIERGRPRHDSSEG